VKTIVQIGIQLTQALDYAHRKGIVHRDVKPGNIMMLNDTNTVKVADFGICRIDNSDVTQATQVGNVLGTPNYMSPEQVLGEKVDSRSDLFSAGVVCISCWVGGGCDRIIWGSRVVRRAAAERTRRARLKICEGMEGGEGSNKIQRRPSDVALTMIATSVIIHEKKRRLGENNLSEKYRGVHKSGWIHWEMFWSGQVRGESWMFLMSK
jgi:serine/threonine protein kinase